MSENFSSHLYIALLDGCIKVLKILIILLKLYISIIYCIKTKNKNISSVNIVDYLSVLCLSVLPHNGKWY